ncbi:MAG: hypothetical protein ABIF12_01615 [bacterium]
MNKNKKLLYIYFWLLLIVSPVAFSTLDFSFLRDEPVVLKKENGFYIVDQKDTNEKRDQTVNLNKGICKNELVVFIHGTILAYPSLSNLLKTLKGNKNSLLSEKSFYHKYINNLRYKGIYKYQPIDELGLNKINLSFNQDDPIYKKSTGKIVSAYNNYYKKISPPKERSYYTFGWSGHLNQKRRICWAENLYNDLINEIKKINNNKNINITILAHSHGGNVALKLAEIEKKYQKGLKIQKLILFGTPIQKETSELIYSDIFEKVYNIYSRGDPVQVIDCISTKDLFSKRKFRGNENGLPEKLTQIEILCGKLKPMHNELWYLKENWNFLYRKRLIVTPYPIAVFAPEIVNFVDSYYSQSINLSLNIEKEKNKLTFSFKDLEKSDNASKYFVDFPNS